MSNLHVDSVKTIEELLSQARECVSTVVVIYIGAKWARVDAATRKFLTQTSVRIPEALFFVLDEANCFPITDHFGVRTFPTTLVMKEGAVVNQMPGGNQAGLSRMIMRACGTNDASIAPPAAASSAGIEHSPSSGGHGGARGTDAEDEMLRRAIEESKRQTYAPSSSHTNSASSSDMAPAEVDAAKLAECLAAVKKVNAEEEAKKKAAEKAAKEAAEEAQRQLAAFPAAAAAAAAAGGGADADADADAESSSQPMESKSESEGVQAQDERNSTLEGPESRLKRPASAASAVDGGGGSAASVEAATKSAESVSEDTAVEESLLAQLLSLEIPKEQAMQAVRNSGATTVDAAMEWIVTRQEKGLAAGAGADGESEMNGGDAGTPTPASASGDAPKAKSIRCTDTGKVFRNMVDAQIYAERTGHTNFEECEEEVREKTAEEKAADRAALLKRIKENKAKKAAQEKEHARLAELERRRQGMLAIKQAEEMKAAQRKREVERIKREKAEKAAAKKRQLELWQLDHKERASGASSSSGGAARKAPHKLTVYEAKAKAKKGVESLKTYMDGVGLRCVKTLAIYVANAQKDDPKFHRINIANKAFANRVKECIGHGGILIAAGFEKVVPGDEASPEGYWQLKERNDERLQAISEILDRAKRSPGFH